MGWPTEVIHALVKQAVSQVAVAAFVPQIAAELHSGAILPPLVAKLQSFRIFPVEGDHSADIPLEKPFKLRHLVFSVRRPAGE